MRSTVIVPVFQEKNILKMFVDSLISTIDDSTEIIFINDGSGNSIQNYLNSVKEENKDFIPITLLEHKTSKGSSCSINEAFRLAKGNYIFLNDSDTILQANWQQKFIETLDSQEKIGMAGGILLYPQTGGIQHCGVGFSNDLGRHVFLNAPLEYAKKGIYPVQLVIFALCAMKREVLEKVGFMDEGFFNGYEDFDFQMRARSLGYEIVVNSDIVAYHWENSNGVHRNFNRKNNLGRFWRKWGHEIKDDLWDIVHSKLCSYIENNSSTFSNKFIGVDLAEVRNDAVMFWKVLKKNDCVDLTEIQDFSHSISSANYIGLPRVIGYDSVSRKENYIFLTDNFVKLLDNKYWFEERSKFSNNDIIVDLYGNIISFNEINNSFWPGTKVR